MEVQHWKLGVEKHLPGLETFFEQVLLTSCEVEQTGCDALDNEKAVEFLKESGFLVRTAEENFQSEILLGFNESWGALLAEKILETEEEVAGEITGELVREVAEKLLETVSSALSKVGVDVVLSDLELIRKGQVKRSLNIQDYLSARFTIGSGDDTEAEDSLPPFEVRAVISRPNEDNFELLEAAFSDENPFISGEYEEKFSNLAAEVEIRRSSDNGREGAAAGLKVEGQNVEFENFDRSSGNRNDREVRNIDILKDVEMDLSVELGRREMPLGKVLQLVKGSVIELEKLAGEPVEILVNGHMIARGDVVVIDEHFGVRISKLLASRERLKGLS